MILDIILLCILLFELFRGLRRGLITSLGMIIVLLISFSLASVYSEPLAQAVLKSRTDFRVQEEIEKRLEEEIQKWAAPSAGAAGKLSLSCIDAEALLPTSSFMEKDQSILLFQRSPQCSQLYSGAKAFKSRPAARLRRASGQSSQYNTKQLDEYLDPSSLQGLSPEQRAQIESELAARGYTLESFFQLSLEERRNLVENWLLEAQLQGELPTQGGDNPAVSPALPQPADPDGAARTGQGSGQNTEQNGGKTPLPNLNYRPQIGQEPGEFTYKIQQSLKNMGLPPAFLGVFEGKYGSIPTQLQSLLEKSRETGTSAIRDAIHNFSRQIFELIAHALAFLLIFFVSHFVLKRLLKALSGLINKIPLIGGLNRLLGMFMGLVVGLALCGLLLSVLPPLSGSLPDLREQLASSRLAAWFMQSQVYEKLLALIY